MVLEFGLSIVAAQLASKWLRKEFNERQDEEIRQMSYEEKRSYVIASQQAYLESLKPRKTWRYRVGFLIGRAIRRS